MKNTYTEVNITPIANAIQYMYIRGVQQQKAFTVQAFLDNSHTSTYMLKSTWMCILYSYQLVLCNLWSCMVGMMLVQICWLTIFWYSCISELNRCSMASIHVLLLLIYLNMMVLIGLNHDHNYILNYLLPPEVMQEHAGRNGR